MNSREDLDAVVSYVMGNEDNLRLALAVLAAGEDIRRHTIDKFLRDLRTELTRQTKMLGEGWEVRQVDVIDYNVNYWQAVYVTKGSWENAYRLTIEPQGSGPKSFALGLASDERLLSHRFDGGRIKLVLDQQMPGGTDSDRWPFYLPLWKVQKEWSDWSQPSTLARLIETDSEGRSKVAREWSELLYQMARIAEPIIDIVVHEWKENLNP